MAFLKSIFKELQNEPQYDYARALNYRRIHLFFKTETRNRNPDNRGICNRNRHFKNRNRKSNSDCSSGTKRAIKNLNTVPAPIQERTVI